MTNDRIHRSGRRRKLRAMHVIFAAFIMVSGSTAVVHDVALARQAESDKNIIAQDNELLELPSSQSRVDEVPADENTLTKMIEEENARVDRLVRSICRGC